MSSTTTITELRSMSLADVRKEALEQRHQVAKLKMLVQMQTEKNTAKYQVAKKKLAQINTILTEKTKEELQSSSSQSKVSAPSA